ncbi:MAG: hypothetical protein AAGF25_08915 [Pseudomonadota bacterium]
MNFTAMESILIITCFIVSVAALLSIFRSQRMHMSVADHEMLRSIIRAEIAQSDVEARQKMFDEFANKLEKDNLRQPWLIGMTGSRFGFIGWHGVKRWAL